MSDQDPTIIPAPETFAPTTDLSMAVEVTTTDGELTCYCRKNSGDGTAFRSWQLNYAGSNDSAVLVQQVNAQAQVLRSWTVHPAPNAKLTTAGLAAGGANGHSLLVLGSGHKITSEAGRENYGMVCEIPNVFTPTGEPGDGVFPEEVLMQPIQQPEPGQTDAQITADDVAALVQVTGATNAAAVFAQLQKAARNGAAQALAAFNFHDGSDGATTLYDRIKETAYESACNAIKAAGLWHGAAEPTTADPNTHEHTNADEVEGQ